MITITEKSRSAVLALTELAQRGSAAPVPILEVAEARGIPLHFLEQLFAGLRRAGILQSQRGVKGGYSFRRPPTEVTILEVVETVDGRITSPAGSGAARGRRLRLGRGPRRPRRAALGPHRRRHGRARGALPERADVPHLSAPALVRAVSAANSRVSPPLARVRPSRVWGALSARCAPRCAPRRERRRRARAASAKLDDVSEPDPDAPPPLGPFGQSKQAMDSA